MRKVTVLSNKGANTVVINTEATTLGELKLEMSAANVNFEGMSIFEGISKTELMDDASILPSNLPYKGQITNDLVILLSVKDKKITSGMASRQEIYAMLTPELKAMVVSKYGKNFTQVSSADLLQVIADASDDNDAEVPTPENNIQEAETPIEALFVSFSLLVKELYEEDFISEEVINNIDKVWGGRLFKIIEEVTEVANTPVKEESPYSTEEMENMFNFVK